VKRLILLALTAAVVAIGIAVPVALAANDSNGTAKLVHVGLNPAECTAPFSNTGTTPTDSGVVNVHYNTVQGRFMVNLSVHDAMPNTTYVLDIRCWTFGPKSELGTLTTNSQGTGTAQFKLDVAMPVNAFYIDISVKGGGGGAGGYGDTFIAGPFTLG
jgi:hypothetical protein